MPAYKSRKRKENHRSRHAGASHDEICDHCANAKRFGHSVDCPNYHTCDRDDNGTRGKCGACDLEERQIQEDRAARAAHPRAWRALLVSRYRHGESMASLAGAFGVSRQRIHQLIRSALPPAP